MIDSQCDGPTYFVPPDSANVRLPANGTTSSSPPPLATPPSRPLPPSPLLIPNPSPSPLNLSTNPSNRSIFSRMLSAFCREALYRSPRSVYVQLASRECLKHWSQAGNSRLHFSLPSRQDVQASWVRWARLRGLVVEPFVVAATGEVEAMLTSWYQDRVLPRCGRGRDGVLGAERCVSCLINDQPYFHSWVLFIKRQASWPSISPRQGVLHKADCLNEDTFQLTKTVVYWCSSGMWRRLSRDA